MRELIIFAGGLGSRLSGTEKMPKPLVPINKSSMLSIIIKEYEKTGVFRKYNILISDHHHLYFIWKEKDMNKILDKCDSLGVPLLLDMAYINISEGININLEHDCIEALTTSLSKVFPLGYVRVGMRMKKENIDDGLDMTTSSDWVNKLGIGMSNYVLEQFDSSFIINKYRQQQHVWNGHQKVSSLLPPTPSRLSTNSSNAGLISVLLRST